MPGYDAVLFEPPAPLARVTFRNPATGSTWSEVPMLLDSGADVTLVPQAAAGRVGATVVPDRQYELVGFGGGRSFAPVTQLELIFLGRTFRGQFLLLDQEWGILERNVLNAVSLILDGPHFLWDELRPG